MRGVSRKNAGSCSWVSSFIPKAGNPLFLLCYKKQKQLPSANFLPLQGEGQDGDGLKMPENYTYPHPNPDETTGHSTRLPKNSSQVAGYLLEGEGASASFDYFYL